MQVQCVVPTLMKFIFHSKLTDSVNHPRCLRWIYVIKMVMKNRSAASSVKEAKLGLQIQRQNELNKTIIGRGKSSKETNLSGKLTLGRGNPIQMKVLCLGLTPQASAQMKT